MLILCKRKKHDLTRLLIRNGFFLCDNLLSRPLISCCFLEDVSPFFVGPPMTLFWTFGDVSSGFQSHNGQPCSCLAEAYVLQIPKDSPLVRHLPKPANIADRL